MEIENKSQTLITPNIHTLKRKQIRKAHNAAVHESSHSNKIKRRRRDDDENNNNSEPCMKKRKKKKKKKKKQQLSTTGDETAGSDDKEEVEKKIEALQRIVPGGESLGVDKLFEETAGYIMTLQVQLKAMKALATFFEGLEKEKNKFGA